MSCHGGYRKSLIFRVQDYTLYGCARGGAARTVLHVRSQQRLTLHHFGGARPAALACAAVSSLSKVPKSKPWIASPYWSNDVFHVLVPARFASRSVQASGDARLAFQEFGSQGEPVPRKSATTIAAAATGPAPEPRLAAGGAEVDGSTASTLLGAAASSSVGGTSLADGPSHNVRAPQREPRKTRPSAGIGTSAPQLGRRQSRVQSRVAADARCMICSDCNSSRRTKS